MNSVPAMKLVSLLSRLALTGIAALILGIAFDTQPLALLATAVSTLVLLVAAGDYAPRTALPRSHPADLVPFAPMPMSNETPEQIAA
jgi:hypothetical protein